jgi:hypothetical protein
MDPGSNPPAEELMPAARLRGLRRRAAASVTLAGTP